MPHPEVEGWGAPQHPLRSEEGWLWGLTVLGRRAAPCPRSYAFCRCSSHPTTGLCKGTATRTRLLERASPAPEPPRDLFRPFSLQLHLSPTSPSAQFSTPKLPHTPGKQSTCKPWASAYFGEPPLRQVGAAASLGTVRPVTKELSFSGNNFYKYNIQWFIAKICSRVDYLIMYTSLYMCIYIYYKCSFFFKLYHML